ncbi:hypothetical protein J6590_102682 [Homalodisca vitripennis]|nr:hypothetical protein J6590_102682 [Homalodisca vitripennis]
MICSKDHANKYIRINSWNAEDQLVITAAGTSQQGTNVQRHVSKQSSSSSNMTRAGCQVTRENLA